MAFCETCRKKEGKLSVLDARGECPVCSKLPPTVPKKKPPKKKLPPRVTKNKPAKVATNKSTGSGVVKCKLKKIKLVELVEVTRVQAGSRKVERTVGGAAGSSAKKTQSTTRTDKLTADGRDHYKQYVNLPKRLVPTGAPHPEYGRFVVLRARVEWKDSSCKDSLAKKSVKWRYHHGAVNGRPSDLRTAEKEGFKRAGGPSSIVTQTDAAGWTPPVKFYLSSYGGDKFRVGVRADTDGKGKWSPRKSTERYQVWRKLWYQVTEMKDHKGGKLDLPAAVTTALEDGFNTVFIEFEEKAPRKLIDHIGHLHNDEKIDKEAKEHFVKDDLCPFKAHIMTADYAKQPKQRIPIRDDAVTTGFWQSPKYYFAWRPDVANYPPVNGKVLAHGKLWANIPGNKINFKRLATGRGFIAFGVDLSYLRPAPSSTKPAKIRLWVTEAGPAPYYGWGGLGQHVILCTGIVRDGNPSGDWDRMQSSDLVHEFGHALGLLNLPPTTRNPHRSWAVPSDLAHCSKPNTTCVMALPSSTTRATTFHYDTTTKTGCHVHLRRQDLSKDVLKNHWNRWK